MDSEARKALAVLPENGIVISSPGEEPIVIQPGSEEISALGGALTFIHVFKDGVPLPAESTSAVVASAGPIFLPEQEAVLLAWAVVLDPKKADSSLRAFSRVTVEDVSGASAVILVDGPPEFPKESDRLVARSSGKRFTKAEFPWMFVDAPTTVILRITLIGLEEETLLQPVVIGEVAKRQVIARLGAAV